MQWKKKIELADALFTGCESCSSSCSCDCSCSGSACDYSCGTGDCSNGY